MSTNYTLPNGVLKNRVGATTAAALVAAEAELVPARRQSWLRTKAGKAPTFDERHLRAIHKHLFQDVFEWAGRMRNEHVRLTDGTTATMPTMMRPGSMPFSPAKDIKRELAALFHDLKNCGHLRNLDRDTFANRAGHAALLRTVHRTQHRRLHRLA